jgi:hypothetical protein
MFLASRQPDLGDVTLKERLARRWVAGFEHLAHTFGARAGRHPIAAPVGLVAGLSSLYAGGRYSLNVAAASGLAETAIGDRRLTVGLGGA